jgi:hypothetical protein
MSIGRELQVNLSTLLGLNNRRPDFRLRTKDGVFIRAAVNADISEANTAKRRQGYTVSITGTDCHSLWVDELSDTAYYVDGTSLYYTTDGTHKTLITNTLVAGRRLTYARVGNEVMFSDGVRNLTTADNSAAAVPLGATPMAAAPAVAGSTGGALDAGYYTVAFGFMNANVEISPLTPNVQVLVPDAGKIVVTGLPATWPADAASLLVYVSSTNGDTLLLERRLSAPATSLDIAVLARSGMQAMTQFTALLPPGRIMRWYGGRLYSALDTLLWYSDVYSPALCTPTKNFIEFPKPITVVEPCDDGLFIVADAAYWLGGDPTSTTAKKVSPTRGIYGTGGHSLAEQKCFWMSDHGLVVGSPGGAIELVQDENVAINQAASGASLFREVDGQRQLLSALFSAEPSTTSARSYMDAEIIRKGTTL